MKSFNRLLGSALIVGTALSLCSFSSDDGRRMKVASTQKVDADDSFDSVMFKAAHVVPTPNQYRYKKTEFIAFVHFGPNTFSRREWGTGTEDPRTFDLKHLDTDQWCRAAKSAGIRMVVFTAKHHDGFCLWQSRYTKHGIMSSPFKQGKGDVLKELSASCRKYGLKLGVYLSPADLFHIENPDGLYGNLSKYSDRVIPRPVAGRPFANKTTFKYNVDDYNEYFLNQLFELLTEYGPIDEVWFDGAHPKTKGGQKYTYAAWRELIRTLAPNAAIFGKEDVRWCGNESGRTRTSEWDVIPFNDDPLSLISFPDIEGNIGERDFLAKAKYLHYLPAETNTSIREGWFYRDDTDQKVRSADDVFDIYERSVGGNSTFMLNIPPNREGMFSPEDVRVLEEVGKRIRQTYTSDLLKGAMGPKEVLDSKEHSSMLLRQGEAIIITTPKAITCNRFVIQEDIARYGQRIEAVTLDAWVNGSWSEVAKGTTVGYKKILRFPEVTSTKFRLRIDGSRLEASVSKLEAYYYKARPALVAIERDVKGMVSLSAAEHTFRWKTHGVNAAENLGSTNVQIRYTTDGSIPTVASPLYTKPFFLPSGEVKARSFIKKEEGSVTSHVFGVLKQDWRLMGVSSTDGDNAGALAFDGSDATFWSSTTTGAHPHHIDIDLGGERLLSGFAYTPQVKNSQGMIEKGQVMVSRDGSQWQLLEGFEIGNLINDPSRRFHYFKKPVSTRYIRIESLAGTGGSTSAAIAEIDFLEKK